MTTVSPPLRAGRSRSAIVRFVVAAIVLLAADLVSKSMSFERVAGQPVAIERDGFGRMIPIPPHSRTIVVPKVLALHLTVNHGAVFGIGQGKRWIFIAFSAVAGIAIPWIFARTHRSQWFVQLALAAVLAGAIGNLHDRIVHGGVRDMFLLLPDVHLPFGLAWPGGSTEVYPWIFNFADVCLVLGLAVLMVVIYRSGEPPEPDPGEADESAADRAPTRTS